MRWKYLYLFSSPHNGDRGMFMELWSYVIVWSVGLWKKIWNDLVVNASSATKTRKLIPKIEIVSSPKSQKGNRIFEEDTIVDDEEDTIVDDEEDEMVGEKNSFSFTKEAMEETFDHEVQEDLDDKESEDGKSEKKSELDEQSMLGKENESMDIPSTPEKKLKRMGSQFLTPEKVTIQATRNQNLRSNSVYTPKVEHIIKYPVSPRTPSRARKPPRRFRNRALTIDTGILATQNSHTPTSMRHPQKKFCYSGLQINAQGIQKIPQHVNNVPLSDKLVDKSMNSMQDFRTLKELGHGRSSRVFLIQHKETEAMYAKKTIYLTVESPDRLIFSEITCLLTLNDSPHTINLYQAFFDGFSIHLILEYAKNGSLDQILKEESFSPLEIQSLFRACVNGMQDLHQKGIIHNDIKPGNIVMMEDGSIKYCDFGLSQHVPFGDKVVGGVAVGTCLFMAPECEASDGYYTCKRDVWSLGMTFIYVLIGYNHFHKLMQPEGNLTYFFLMAQIHRLKTKELPHLCKGNPLLFDLLQNCLNEDQERRPSSEQLSRHPYFFMSNDETVSKKYRLLNH